MKFTAFPFIRYLLFFLSGIVVYVRTYYFNPFFYGILGVILLIFGGLLFFKKYHFLGLLFPFFFFLFGWIIGYQRTPVASDFHYLNQGLFTHYQAVATANVEVKPKTYKVEAEIKSIKSKDKWRPAIGKVLLYFNKEEAPRPNYGDVFLLKGVPREVEPPKNPQEFDYRKFLQYKGLYAHHFLRQNDFVKLGNDPPSKLMKWAINANNYADSLFKTHLQTKNEYAIANAMVVGLRDDVDNDLMQAYSASGAIHVLSVSGMHVAILFAMLRLIFGKIKRLKYGIFIFNALIISLLWGYAVFTGLSSTVLRATVMFTFVQVAEIINRKSSIYNTLAISAFALLCWNPFWAFDVGFQLSYLAIIGIVYLHPLINQLLTPSNKILRIAWEISSVAFSAQLATFPLSIYYFHQFPTYFLLANPFVFLFSEGILPLGLLLLLLGWIPFLAKIIAFWLKLTLWLLNQSLFLIEKIPFSILKGFSISLPETILIYLFLLFIIAFFRTSELKYLRVSLGILLSLTAWNIIEDFQQSRQKWLTFHFIPKKSGISIIDGKIATFLADTALLQNPKIYDFHLKNFYDFQGIERRNLVDINHFSTQAGISYIFFEGKRVLWLHQPFRGELGGKMDYLLISNNALQNISPNFLNLSVREIIADDSNKRYLIENLQRQADSLHIRFISLHDSGALTIK